MNACRVQEWIAWQGDKGLIQTAWRDRGHNGNRSAETCEDERGKKIGEEGRICDVKRGERNVLVAEMSEETF